MTDFITGLLQRSMGLTPAVKPVVRPQSAVDVASSALRQVGAQAEMDQLEASPADISPQTIPSESSQTTSAPVSPFERPTEASGPRNPNEAPPIQESTPASQPPATYSPRLSQKKSSAIDSSTVSSRPATRPVEHTGKPEPVDIPVSRLVSGRPARQKGPLEGRRSVQANSLASVKPSPMPESARSSAAPVPMRSLIRSLASLQHGDAGQSLEGVPAESTATEGDFGPRNRETIETRLSFNKRAVANHAPQGRSEPDESLSGSAMELTATGIVPNPPGSRPQHPTGQQVPRGPSPRARERLVYNEPPLPSIEVTIGRVEVRAILPPSPAPPTPTRRKSPIVPLDEYLKARKEGKR